MLQESLLEVRKGSCNKCNTCLNFYPNDLYTYIEITNNTQTYKNYKTTKLSKNNNFVQHKYQILQKNNEKLI